MDDEALDALLSRSAAAPSLAAVDTARLIAQQTAKNQRRRAHRMLRRPVLVIGLGAGALFLAGAGTLTAYQLSLPPFQTTDPGSERAAPVALDYTNSLGKRVRCLAFSEWENLTDAQRTVLASLPDDPFWVGYGDRVLAEEGLKNAPVLDQEQAVFTHADQDIQQRAEAALTSTTGLDHAVQAGFSASCAPGGADGQ
jgi:hypothetical protein